MGQLLAQILQRPVPDFSAVRKAHTNYRDYALNARSPRSSEPLVDIVQHGLAGQSYYSRPNGATGKPLPGVEPTVWLRESIAQKLAAINYELLRSKEVTELLGGRVELYIDEGWRSTAVQRALYETHIPALIRAQHPTWDEKQVMARRDGLISRPSDGLSPAPHATGAAVDLKLRFVQDNPSFVATAALPLTAKRTTTSEETFPDFYEHKRSLTKDEETIRRNRRVFYWVMRGALNSDDFGFVVNPTEWWHWSFGDQMWAARTKAPQAFFAAAPKVATRS